MATFFEYDPLTGVRYDFDYDPVTGEAAVGYTQNVQPVLDLAHRVRVDKVTDPGIKAGFWHYCTIPTTVQIELLKKGIDIGKANDFPRLFAEINTNYPHLKMTEKNCGGKVKQIYIPPSVSHGTD